jgi:RHS repeat-associated protein
LIVRIEIRLLFFAVVAMPWCAQAQEFRSFYVTDVLGSPVASTDSYANIRWREDYRPYGERATAGAPDSNDGDNERWFTGAPQNDVTGLTYLEHRFYDPVVGRFLSIDPRGLSPRNGENFNRYWYANNNPYRFTDPDGRWASQKGFYVHQRVTHLLLSRYVDYDSMHWLNHAHVIADAPRFQGPDSSFRHAMRNGQQTVAEARQMANDFVRAQFEKAWNAPTYRQSLVEFGIALHTLQDSTSPAHGGFQVWTGEETFGEQYDHVEQELENPGEGSELYRVTRDAWKWFTEKKLPEGDLFTYGVDVDD